MHIGIAGTGKMGSAITRRLLGSGHAVTVWNRNPARAQPLLDAGATWAASPRALAQARETVITMLTDQSASDAVYSGPNRLKTRGPMIAKALAGTSDGSVSVDLATMRKDLRAMLTQAALGQQRLPLAALTLQSIEHASAQGLAAADCTQLPVCWLKAGGKL